MTELRRATLEDLPRIIELGIELHAESPRFSRFRFDESKAADFMAHLITSSSGFVLLAVRCERVIGGVAAMMTSEWFSHDTFAYEVSVFIEKAHRGSTLPVRLLHAYRDWATERGARCAVAGVGTGINADGTAKLYQLAGMKPIGQSLEFTQGG